MMDNTSVPQKLFCMGRHYIAHVGELNHAMPKQPVVFLQAKTRVSDVDSLISFAAGDFIMSRMPGGVARINLGDGFVAKIFE